MISAIYQRKHLLQVYVDKKTVTTVINYNNLIL